MLEKIFKVIEILKIMKKEGYRKAVFVVVYSRTKGEINYLLLKRKLHWKGWEFCKGGCDAKEKEKLCVLREVKEETGQKAINIKTYNKKGKYKWERGLEDRPEFVGQTYTLYSAEISKNKKIKFDDKEHSNHKWVNYSNALKMLTWPNQRMCLKIVDKSL